MKDKYSKPGWLIIDQHGYGHTIEPHELANWKPEDILMKFEIKFAWVPLVRNEDQPICELK